MPVDRSCPICVNSEHHVIPYSGRAKLPVQPAICKSCGLVFINPMYSNAEKDAVAACPRALHRPVRFGRPIQRAHERELRGAQRFLEFVRPHLKPGDRVLDIGCGDGALVRTLQQFGAVPMGVDLDPEGARFIEQSYRIPVVVSPFETAAFADGQFDAVVATHVIEHFFAPVDAMEKMRRLLKPNGLLVLEAPNILRPKVGFHRLFSVPHNYYFSPRTLCLAMQRAGFAAVAVREFHRDSFLVAARAVVDRSTLPLLRGDDWQQVAQRILSHDFRYKASLQFVWRKIPGLKYAIMYRVHRDMAGENLSRWLARAA
jgi:2-polyprenyl-3-methyl-5-hydroxy-6-metoxy-1,4-benzoquinol methylase